tara:strand:- start:107 stop:322 length:216 start_codon:yes stop_codon:yes gene_type:complete
MNYFNYSNFNIEKLYKTNYWVDENHHNHLLSIKKLSGAKETRTPDPLHAMQVLYQLSYGPKSRNVSRNNLT